MTLLALNTLVGTLFLSRRPSRARAALLPTLSALASVMVSGAVLALARAEMGPIARTVFAVAGAGAFFALANLGRNFAVLPSLRSIVVRGPYGWVRHPVYVFELIMLVAAALSASWVAWSLAAVAVALLLRRIHDEERVLSRDPSYASYRARVRYRLIPGVF